jgi:hypothetical protein
MHTRLIIIATLGTEVVKISDGSVRVSRAAKQAAKLTPMYLPAVVSIISEDDFRRQ